MEQVCLAAKLSPISGSQIRAAFAYGEDLRELVLVAGWVAAPAAGEGAQLVPSSAVPSWPSGPKEDRSKPFRLCKPGKR